MSTLTLGGFVIKFSKFVRLPAKWCDGRRGRELSTGSSSCTWTTGRELSQESPFAWLALAGSLPTLKLLVSPIVSLRLVDSFFPDI